MVSTYLLAMKFPTLNRVGIFRGNQQRARKCYVEVVNKVCHKVPRLAVVTAQLVVVTNIFKINETDTPNGEIKLLSDLDLRLSKEGSQAQPVKDLVPYYLDLEYSDMIVLLGSKLRLEIPVKLE